MTAREAVCLNESVPQLQVPQAADTYLFPRDCAFTTAVLTSSVADGATAVGFTLTTAAMSTAGAKLLSVTNNGTEKLSLGYDGQLTQTYSATKHITLHANSGGGASGGIIGGTGISTFAFSFGTTGIFYLDEDGSYNHTLRTLGNFTIKPLDRTTGDSAATTTTLRGGHAYASAVTNLVGGAAYVAGGAGASGSAGAAHGGALYLDGGQGYGTGSHGSIYLGNSYCNGIICGTNFQQFTEMTAPAAGASNTVRLYAEDNGAGKTRLMAIFPTGAAQQVAIEP